MTKPKALRQPPRPGAPEWEHPPLKCPVCGELMAFLEYGSKIGKNGAPAKWPIYAPCSKVRHAPPKHYRSLVVQDEPLLVINNPTRLVEGRSGPKGNLYQLPAMTFLELQHALDLFAGRHGTAPASIHINPLDLGRLPKGSDGKPLEAYALIPLVPDSRFTPGFRYVFLEISS